MSSVASDTAKTDRGGFAAACLASRRWQAPESGSMVAMSAAAAQALADLMPLLLCGEESAEFVFAAAVPELPRNIDPALPLELARIADDERRHGVYLSALRNRLPPPADVGATRRATRFLRKLATTDLGLHLARVAALDAGFCQVLAEICRPGTEIAKVPELVDIFRRIRSDEGRHVRVSRRCAAALGVSPRTEHEERRWVLHEFATLLTAAAPAFAAVGADMERLLGRLARTSIRSATRGSG
jgi:hypothetical protein